MVQPTLRQKRHVGQPTASIMILRIGYTNAKQLEKRLAMFRITETELAEAMKIVEEEL